MEDEQQYEGEPRVYWDENPNGYEVPENHGTPSADSDADESLLEHLLDIDVV